jgi:hypothetical protein
VPKPSAGHSTLVAVSRTSAEQDAGVPRANDAASPARAAGRDTIASVKRTFAWLAGLAGLAALGRMLARRKRSPEKVAEHPEAATADPAEELRDKLAEQRQAEPAVEPPPVSETLEERRARVHTKAREAIDSMHDEGPAA